MQNREHGVTLVPGSSNVDEPAGAAAKARPVPLLQPAVRPKVLAQTRPSTKWDHDVYDESKRTREFQDHWLGIYNYLRYDKKANVMYCIN